MSQNYLEDSPCFFGKNPNDGSLTILFLNLLFSLQGRVDPLIRHNTEENWGPGSFIYFSGDPWSFSFLSSSNRDNVPNFHHNPHSTALHFTSTDFLLFSALHLGVRGGRSVTSFIHCYCLARSLASKYNWMVSYGPVIKITYLIQPFYVWHNSLWIFFCNTNASP